MKKVLLIGANSYIAKSFEQFINGNNHNLVIEVDKVSASNEEWKALDLSVYDAIVMLAAIVHQREKVDMEELYMKVNCRLPVEIAKKAKEAGVKQFIFLSSAAVYGRKYSRITINTVPHPETMYGISKYEAEKQINKLNSENFKVAIIRAPKVYGEGCKGNFIKLEKLVMFTPFFPKFHNRQSMIHIEKLCEHIKCLIDNVSEGLYLPQDDNYMDITALVIKMRANKGKKTILVPGFSWLLKILMKYNNTFKKMFGDLYYDEF